MGILSAIRGAFQEGDGDIIEPEDWEAFIQRLIGLKESSRKYYEVGENAHVMPQYIKAVQRLIKTVEDKWGFISLKEYLVML